MTMLFMPMAATTRSMLAVAMMPFTAELEMIRLMVKEEMIPSLAEKGMIP